MDKKIEKSVLIWNMSSELQVWDVCSICYFCNRFTDTGIEFKGNFNYRFHFCGMCVDEWQRQGKKIVFTINSYTDGKYTFDMTDGEESIEIYIEHNNNKFHAVCY